MIKVVVFDAFNTLVKRNKKYVIEPYKLVQERATKELFNPMGTNLSVREYAEAIGSAYSEDEMLDIERRLALEISKITPFEEAIDVVKGVNKLGLKVAIGSNLAPAYGPVLKEIFGDLVDHYFLSYEMGVPKPAPEFYEAIMAHYGLTPSEFYMVGDSKRNDFEAPRSMGWKAVLLDRKSKEPFSISRLNSIFIDLRNIHG